MIRSLALLLTLALAACVAPQAPSESRSAPGAMNTMMDVAECTVISSRQVRLTTPYTGGSNRYMPATGPRQNMGAAGGALAGAALGRKFGGKDGALIGAVLGGFAGSTAGARSDANAPYAYGNELIVRLKNGRTISVTQGMSPSDRALHPGQSCGLIGGRSGQARVIAY